MLKQSNKAIFKQLTYFSSPGINSLCQSLRTTRGGGVPYSGRLTGSSGHTSWGLRLEKTSEDSRYLALASGKGY